MLLLGTLVLLGGVVFPLAKALLVAGVLAALLWPLGQRLARHLGRRRGRSIAAGILTFAVTLLLVGPLAGLSAYAAREISEGIEFVASTIRSEGMTGLIGRLPPSLQQPAQQLLSQLPSSGAAGAVGAALTATGSLLFQTVMMLIALFCLLAQGDRLVDWIDQVSPLGKGRTIQLLGAVKTITSSVITSTLITSAIQAAVALVGYLLARVPNPVFFTLLTFFIAFIPAIGAGAVVLTAAGLLYLTGHPWPALFLAIWGLVAVGLIDNVVKPFLIKGESRVHGAVVFFALLGGLAAFGAVGLLIGPLAVALFLELVSIHQRDFTGATPRAPPT